VCTCYVKTLWDPDASTHGRKVVRFRCDLPRLDFMAGRLGPGVGCRVGGGAAHSAGFSVGRGRLGRGRGRVVGSVASAAARRWPRGGREEVVAPAAMAAVPTSAGRDREGRG